ncbi:isovaleryl-CoA dehydrogenase [Chitiniphilus shinanonensis]|uniref:isovaleryl-CoA dehydrogenase n=1 Tax=Chitiniphilus shinanonensis TaxID=553088 RepID=UPI0030536986
MATHTVFNQSEPLAAYNLFLRDAPLVEALTRHGAGWAHHDLAALGERLGQPMLFELARQAELNPPQLYRYDAHGQRIDDVQFDLAWHALMTEVTASGLHNSPWAQPGAGATVARAARFLLHAQVDAASLCPVTMTHAAIPVLLDHQDSLPLGAWRPILLSNQYDPRPLPAAAKDGLLLGMGATEKQGGSDLRANTTRARSDGVGGPGAVYRLTGHKWFFSVPQSDAHLVVAQADGGLSCFLLPRLLPDGRRNALRIERLKHKLGNRGNASAEVEFDDALGWLIGEEGQGARLIASVANRTRLDCALGSIGLMRRALTLALHHAGQRHAFGRPLIEQPLMRNVLADLALELEGAIALAMRLAAAWDNEAEPQQAALARVLTPAAKYLLCKRGPGFIAEAMEVLGGNGYVEESDLPRLYREMPVNSIWEGAGNIMALDVLRALSRDPATLPALHAELSRVRGQNRHYDATLNYLATLLHAAEPATLRIVSELLVQLIAAGELLQHAPSPIAEAWCAARLGTRHQQYGAFNAPEAVALLLARAWREGGDDDGIGRGGVVDTLGLG